MTDRDYDDLKARQVILEEELGKALVEIVVLKKYNEEAADKIQWREGEMEEIMAQAFSTREALKNLFLDPGNIENKLTAKQLLGDPSIYFGTKGID